MKIKELFYRIKTPVRASVFYLGASVVGKAVGLLTTPYFTRVLSAEDYGKFSLYMSLLGGISVIVSAFNSGSAVYSGLDRSSDNEGSYIKGVWYVSCTFSLLITSVLTVFSPFFGLDRKIALILSLQIICDGIVATSLCLSKYKYRYTRVFVISVISAAFPPLIAAAFIRKYGGGYVVRIYSLLAVSVCIAACALVSIPKSKEKLKMSEIKRIVKSSLPLLPHTASNALTVQADKLILSTVMGADALAKYSVVYSLGAGLGFTVSAISGSLSPWIIRRLDRGDEEKISELVIPMIIGYFSLSAMIMAFAPETIKILAPESYLDALPALLPLTLCTPFTFLSTVTTVSLVHHKKGRYSAISSLVGAVCCVVLSFIFISQFGYLGAGMAMLISKIGEAMTAIYFLARCGVRNIISSKLFLPVLLTVLSGIILYQLRGNPIGRFSVLVLPFSILLYSLWKGKALLFEKA